MKDFLTIPLVILCLSIDLTTSETDLYDVLSVERNANPKQIKQAYKKLAKEWHPDKNRDTGANEKFMKINEAYETLSDPEKRTEYDKFGRTSPQQQHQSDHPNDRFEQFFGHGFGGGGFRFNFHDGMDDKYRITLRSWTKNVLPESDTKPYVVYAYSDFSCFKCMQLEPIWDKFTADLELIGMGIGTINTRMDGDLAYKLGIGSLPQIFVIISGKLTYYSKTHYSLSELRFFLRDLKMSRDIQQVDGGNYKDFLASWTDNHVRVVYYSSKQYPPLRIVLAAYAFRQHIVFGHVNALKPENAGLLSDYGVNPMAETLMVFHEDVSSPVATMSMQQLGRQSIDEVLEANKYLTLPRLSSSAIFKDLCPTEKAIRNRKLCVVLLTKSTAAHDDHRQTFRDYARQHPENRLRFVYMYEDKQTVFIHSLTKGGVHSDSSTKLKIAILWRPDGWRVTYSWLNGGWDVDSLNQCEMELTAALDKILTHNTELTMVAKWTELVDEHQLHLLTRIGIRLLDWADNIYHYLASYDTLTLTTVATAVVIMVFMGYFMQYIIAESDESRSRPNNIRRQTPRASPAGTVESVRFRELGFETFDQLVVESEPGKITVVLLTLEQTRDKLLQTYADIVKPYSRSKYFTFAFLQLETYLFWYEHLLEETIGYRRTISINPHNVVGTVLVLNGFRKYYCMYHAVHKQHKRKQKQSGGEFMGFNASDSSSDSDDQAGNESTTPDILFEKDLLNELQNFMDRFVEGSLKRYKVEHWPEMVTY